MKLYIASYTCCIIAVDVIISLCGMTSSYVYVATLFGVKMHAWSSDIAVLTIAHYVFSACTHNLWGDHPWLGGTTYGAVDGPGGPSMAAIVSLGDQLWQQNLP